MSTHVRSSMFWFFKMYKFHCVQNIMHCMKLITRLPYPEAKHILIKPELATHNVFFPTKDNEDEFIKIVCIVYPHFMHAQDGMF